MDISVKELQEAISIRQQIDNLQRRLSSLLRGAGAPQREAAPRTSGRYFSPATRAKLSEAAKARWASRRGTTAAAAPSKRKGQLTPAGRKKLSQLMKARWAARRKAGGTQKTSTRKKGALTPAGRKRLSELMKARWAARRKAGK
jgi:Spy/CpxP family protein refolding chaperone